MLTKDTLMQIGRNQKVSFHLLEIKGQGSPLVLYTRTAGGSDASLIL